MKCPKCSSERSSVLDSRSDRDTIRRRRECQSCAYRFSTFERVEYSFPIILKKDGVSEQYSRDKLQGGVLKACQKRPVSADQIDDMIEQVERKIQELCVKELPSRQIGDFLMEELRKIDKIAYVRFASVYREFSDVSQFVDTLQNLDEPENDEDIDKAV